MVCCLLTTAVLVADLLSLTIQLDLCVFDADSFNDKFKVVLLVE